MAFIDTHFCSLTKVQDALPLFALKHYKNFYEIRLTDIADDVEYFLDPLQTDLNVWMEYPYLDKVYRDSYYSYFATKHKQYPKNCIRLSFFDRTITKRLLNSLGNHEKIQKGFLGYCVIRPTKDRVIGRNLISKVALNFADFQICQHKEEVLIAGRKLIVRGFSHSSQDKETISCAETTLWAVMEYFGHKYPEYKPTLPSAIINRLNAQSSVRMLPSNGLSPDQIAFALKAEGFGPWIYDSQGGEQGFQDLLHIYIESGIPVISIIESSDKKSAHAQLIIGRQMPSLAEQERIVTEQNENLINFSFCVSRLVFQDDNLAPYQLMTADDPVSNYPKEWEFGGFTLTAFIVPLYKKIYLEAGKARDFFREGFKEYNDEDNRGSKFLFRMYLASSRSFKGFVKNLPQLDSDLKHILLALSLPKFIWCAEFTEVTQIKTGEISSLMILDATEVSDYWKDSFIFAAHKKISFIKIEEHHLVNKYGTTDFEYRKGLTGFTPYSKNLT